LAAWQTAAGLIELALDDSRIGGQQIDGIDMNVGCECHTAAQADGLRGEFFWK
jgi:hypothetical protein